jgi:hypothetical protein
MNLQPVTNFTESGCYTMRLSATTRQMNVDIIDPKNEVVASHSERAEQAAWMNPTEFPLAWQKAWWHCYRHEGEASNLVGFLEKSDRERQVSVADFVEVGIDRNGVGIWQFIHREREDNSTDPYDNYFSRFDR